MWTMALERDFARHRNFLRQSPDARPVSEAHDIFASPSPISKNIFSHRNISKKFSVSKKIKKIFSVNFPAPDLQKFGTNFLTNPRRKTHPRKPPFSRSTPSPIRAQDVPRSPTFPGKQPHTTPDWDLRQPPSESPGSFLQGGSDDSSPMLVQSREYGFSPTGPPPAHSTPSAFGTDQNPGPAEAHSPYPLKRTNRPILTRSEATRRHLRRKIKRK